MSALNGDSLMAEWCQMLCANFAKGSSKDQLSCWKLQNARRYCSSFWLIRSVCPSV